MGPADIAVGRHRLHELCGYTSADHSSFQYYADGPTRVVEEVTICRAHQHAAGARKKRGAWPGRT